MSSITFSKQIESDMLHLPELLPFVGHRVEIVVHDSEAPAELANARFALLNTLQETYQRYQQPHWDGEQAEAISIETFEVARRFIETLPLHSTLPTITPEPDGQLNFEWYHSPRRLLTVSLSAGGTLHWAALIGSEDPRGSCQFVDRFPKTLLYWISQVFE